MFANAVLVCVLGVGYLAYASCGGRGRVALACCTAALAAACTWLLVRPLWVEDNLRARVVISPLLSVSECTALIAAADAEGQWRQCSRGSGVGTHLLFRTCCLAAERTQTDRHSARNRLQPTGRQQGLTLG